MYDEDVAIKMPPKHRYKIELDVISIKKAKPELFLDDWLALAELSFGFWDNKEDSIYNEEAL